MLSKIEGRNYVFLLDGDRFPVKVNRKVMDRALLDIEVSFKKVQLLLKNLYETDYAAYAFICDMVFENNSRFDLDDGSSFLIDQVVENAVSVHERLLTSNDEIKPQEEIETLEDLGYHWYGGGLAPTCISRCYRPALSRHLATLSRTPVYRGFVLSPFLLFFICFPFV